jgi:hypothetical protein
VPDYVTICIDTTSALYFFVVEVTKNPHTLRRPSLSVRISCIVKGIKQALFTMPILSKNEVKINGN